MRPRMCRRAVAVGSRASASTRHSLRHRMYSQSPCWLVGAGPCLRRGTVDMDCKQQDNLDAMSSGHRKAVRCTTGGLASPPVPAKSSSSFDRHRIRRSSLLMSPRPSVCLRSSGAVASSSKSRGYREVASRRRSSTGVQSLISSAASLRAASILLLLRSEKTQGWVVGAAKRS